MARDGRTWHFVPPTLIEIDRHASSQREVFGPVLHVLRYGASDSTQTAGAASTPPATA